MRKIIHAWGTAFNAMAIVAWLGLASPLLAQSVQVTSAAPNNAAEGTVNLNVVVGGKGFEKGANAQWFVSGTTNPGGVTVNSTTFNSSTQLTANITVSGTATIASYDIQVTNRPGRSGKGTGLFSVTSSNGVNSGCTTLGTPTGFNLVSTLNYVNSSGAPQYPSLGGSAVRARPVVLTAGTVSKTVVVAASRGNSTLEIFILDPATGNVLDGTVIVGSQVQPHISVPVSSIGGILEVGDVDGNGIPDFVMHSLDGTTAAAYVAMGHEDSSGILSYGPAITVIPPDGSINRGLAMGDLDGSPVLVVGSSSSVYIYQFNGSVTNPGFNVIGTVNDPLSSKKSSDNFGQSVALGDVTGSGASSLIVGAPGATVSGFTGAGLVYVFPAPLTATPPYFTFTSSPSNNEELGWHVGAGTFTKSTVTDLVATTGWLATSENVSIFGGPITGNRTSPYKTFLPYPGLSAGGGGWSTNFDLGDMNGDGWSDVVVGAPNGNNSTQCNTSVGSAQLYLSSVGGSGPQWSRFVFQPPTVQTDFMGFGYGVSIVPAVTSVAGFTPLLVVGEPGRDLGGVTSAGQVYVYKQQ